MPDSLLTSPTFKTVSRVVVVAGGAGLFFLAARTIDPNPSAATGGAVVPGPGQPSTSTVAPAPERSLGRFQGADHTVYAVATPDGPRYTVADEHGDVLESGLREYEVYQALQDHGIDVGRPVSEPIMMADDQDGPLD